MDTMTLGLAIFFVVHLLPAATKFRDILFLKLGEKAYKGIYALISFAGLYLVVTGKGEAEFIPLWEPAEWSYVATNASMMLALCCLVAMNMPSNLKRFTAHPMLWGITFWSAGHLLTNGDQASIILFGSFLTYSLFAMFSANRRGASPHGVKVSVRHDATVVVIGAVIYVLLANFHAFFTGITLIR